MLAVTADIAGASIPVALIAGVTTVVGSWLVYLAARRSTPAVAAAKKVEPRIASAERRTAAWTDLLDRSDAQLDWYASQLAEERITSARERARADQAELELRTERARLERYLLVRGLPDDPPRSGVDTGDLAP